MHRSTAEGFRWEPQSTTRLGLWATLASAGIAILAAVFQVQGWKMPKPLALLLIALLVVVIVAAVGMFVYEIIRTSQRFLEHRATSSAYVLSERPGALDYEADGIRAMRRLTKVLDGLSAGTADLGEKMSVRGKQIENAAAKSPKGRQRLANRTAKEIDKSAVFIEKRIALLKALVNDIYRNYQGLILVAAAETEEEIRVATVLKDILRGTQLEAATASEQVLEYRDSARGLEERNISRTMRIASKRLADGLNEVGVMLKQYEKRCASLVTEFEQKLAGR
jgi:hypothetical protein